MKNEAKIMMNDGDIVTMYEQTSKHDNWLLYVIKLPKKMPKTSSILYQTKDISIKIAY